VQCACGDCENIGCAADDEWYPPHTHGLHKGGMPELLLAHGGFSINDIQAILESSADFLWRSPEVLQTLRDGKTLQIPTEDICGPTQSGVKFESHFRPVDFNEPLVQMAYFGMERQRQEFIAVCVHEAPTRH